MPVTVLLLHGCRGAPRVPGKSVIIDVDTYASEVYQLAMAGVDMASPIMYGSVAFCRVTPAVFC